jgi:sugar lactone lactonase YvrE
MLHEMMTARGAAVLLAAALGIACGGGERRAGGDDTSTADSVAAAPAGPSARPVATVDSLQGPEAARWDPEQKVWFVSNINGNPSGKDNNGFIARVSPDGKVDSLKFIAGGRGGVTLNAPKGMAIVGDTLWVADIDYVRGFNRKTGKLVSNIRVPGAKFLNDVAVGPDGIYATDTGVEFTPDGQTKHPGPDAVYRIAARRVTTAMKFDGQPGPNGLTWDSAGSRFIIVPFQDNAISAWAPGDSTPQKIGEGPGMQDGIETFGGGRFLVTSWADSSLSVLSEGKLTRIAGGLPGGADLGYDRESGRVAVPQLTENKVTILQVDPGQ